LPKHCARRVSCEPGGGSHGSCQGPSNLRFQRSAPWHRGQLQQQCQQCQHACAHRWGTHRLGRDRKIRPEGLTKMRGQDSRFRYQNMPTGIQLLKASLVGRVAHWCRWHHEWHNVDPCSTLTSLTRNCDISQRSTPRDFFPGPRQALSRRHGHDGRLIAPRHPRSRGRVDVRNLCNFVELQAGRHPFSQDFVQCGPVWALHVASHGYSV